MSSPNVLCHGSLRVLEEVLAAEDDGAAAETRCAALQKAAWDFVAHALQPLLAGCVRRADPAANLLASHSFFAPGDDHAESFVLSRDTEVELATLGLYELVCDNGMLYELGCDANGRRLVLDQATGTCGLSLACVRGVRREHAYACAVSMRSRTLFRPTCAAHKAWRRHSPNPSTAYCQISCRLLILTLPRTHMKRAPHMQWTHASGWCTQWHVHCANPRHAASCMCSSCCRARLPQLLRVLGMVLR